MHQATSATTPSPRRTRRDEPSTLRRERDDAIARARALEHELGALRGRVRQLELARHRRTLGRRRWVELAQRLRAAERPTDVLRTAWRVRWSPVARRLGLRR